MKSRFMKVACLTVLIMGSALQAMDVPAGNDLNPQLIEAARNGEIEQVRQLLTENVDVNAKDAGGRTALFFAARNGSRDICELLLTNKADVNAKSNGGFTPLMAAIRCNQRDVCELLLAMNADVNAKNNNGETALLFAADSYNLEICKLLINAMIKPTKDQIKRVVALLGIAKKRQIGALNAMPRDVVKLIGREQYNDLRRLNKPDAEVEIDRIPNNMNAMKHELLEYLNSL